MQTMLERPADSLDARSVNLATQAEQITGGPRGDIGGAISNPGAAPQQQRGGNRITPNGVGWSLN